MEEDIFDGYGIEVVLKKPDDFLKVKETLTRIGISSKRTNTLYQSCHILHKQGRYVIIHFLELFELDGKKSNFSEADEARRNTIAKLLEDWGLVEIIDDDFDELPKSPITAFKILPFKEKSNWILKPKYQVGIAKI